MKNFIRYINEELEVNQDSFVQDFRTTYISFIDQTNRGFVSAFELHALCENKIHVKVNLLDYVKEGLNAIVEIDNIVNKELEKIYLKFDDMGSSSPQQPLNISATKDALHFLILDQKKERKKFNIENYLQAVKDYSLYENIDSL